MFGWLFSTSCPCDPSAKAWVEERLEWLAAEFDDSAFTGRRVVLPTLAFFPDAYDASADAVRTLLNRVCGYMDVDPDLVSLKFIAGGGDTWLVNEAGDVLPNAAASSSASPNLNCTSRWSWSAPSPTNSPT